MWDGIAESDAPLNAFLLHKKGLCVVPWYPSLLLDASWKDFSLPFCTSISAVGYEQDFDIMLQSKHARHVREHECGEEATHCFTCGTWWPPLPHDQNHIIKPLKRRSRQLYGICVITSLL